MKKIFSKVAILTLGVALAAGAGVALSAHKEAMGVSAADVKVYTLNGNTTGGTSGYAEESEITQDGIKWSVEGNTTMSPWRIGGKSLTNKDRVIYSKDAIADDISKIEVQHGTISGTTVNSWTVIVASDASFNNVISSLTPTFAANSTITINRPAGKSWAGAYYKLVYNLTISSTSSNKYLTFTGATFYKTPEEKPLESISINDVGTMHPGQTAALEVVPSPEGAALPADLQYTSSNQSAVTVSAAGVVTAVAKGTSTVTATSAADNTITASTTVTVENYPLQGIEVGKTYALVNAAGTHELSGVNTSGSTKYGTVVTYEDEPANVYTVEVEAGLYAGSVSFKVAAGYLIWPNDAKNSLSVQESKDAYASWVVEKVTVEEVEEFKVTNVPTYGLPQERMIRFNSGSGSERFACYTQNQDPVNFIEVGGVTPTPAQEADTFAQALLDSMTCNDDGASAPTTVVAWSTIAGQYEALSQDAKDIFAAAEPDAEGSKVEEALARYEMVVAKYGYDDFMNRNVAPAGNVTTVDNGFNATALIIVVAAIALTSVAGIVTVIIIRRRRFHN